MAQEGLSEQQDEELKAQYMQKFKQLEELLPQRKKDNNDEGRFFFEGVIRRKYDPD